MGFFRKKKSLCIHPSILDSSQQTKFFWRFGPLAFSTPKTRSTTDDRRRGGEAARRRARRRGERTSNLLTFL